MLIVSLIIFLFITDGSGGNIFRSFAICSFYSWPSWGLVGINSLHGLACCGRLCQVMYTMSNFVSCWCISFDENYFKASLVSVFYVIYEHN